MIKRCEMLELFAVLLREEHVHKGVHSEREDTFTSAFGAFCADSL